MDERAIRILLVDDHELIRSGLGSVIDLEPDLSVVATAGTVSEALTKYEELNPTVVVADLQLPDGTGLDIVRAVRGKSDTTGLVVLTMHSGDEQIFAAMQAGVFVPDHPAGQIAGHAAEDRFGLAIQVGEPPIAVQGEERVGDALQDHARLLDRRKGATEFVLAR